MKEIYINGIILDGTKQMQPVRNKVIVVEDGIISDIRDDDKNYDGYKVIDLHNQYIMPGLINLHVHLALKGEAAKKPKKNQKPIDYKKLYDFVSRHPLIIKMFRNKSIAYAKDQLLSGTTTIRTVGGIMDFDTYIRDKVKEGKLVGPRILASNAAISVPGGHFAGSLASTSKTPEEAIRDIDEVAKTKPDLIKLMITGGVMDCEVVGEPGIVKMSEDIVRVATKHAHDLGYKVAAHVESPAGVKLALKYGVDTIEHGAKPDQEMIDLFKKTGSVLINTFSPAVPYALFDTEISHATEIAHINGKALFKGEIECARACLENNVRIGLGNDCSCPFITHYDFWRELVYLVNFTGVSNAYALYLATLNNAEIAGIDKVTGSIEKGKAADFIVTKENPLENLKVLRNIEMVVSQGKIYNHPQIKKMKDVDDELDKFLDAKECE